MVLAYKAPMDPVNMWKNSHFLKFSHIFTGTASANFPEWVKRDAHFDASLAKLTHANFQRGIYYSINAFSPILFVDKQNNWGIMGIASLAKILKPA